MSNVSNPSASAGFSFPHKQKRDVICEAYAIAKYMMHSIKYDYSAYQPPSKIAFRGHLSPIEDPKTRPVWVAPFEVIILEQVFGQELVDRMKSGLGIIHFGEDAMPRLAQLLSTDIERYEYVALTQDWKSFDATIPNFIIDEVFKMFKDSIDFTQMKVGNEIQTISQKAAAKLEKVFDWVKWNFTHTKIMLPDGRMVRKQSGIPSGSYFTSLVGSIANAIAQNYMMSVMNMTIQEEHYLGDDSLIMIP